MIGNVSGIGRFQWDDFQRNFDHRKPDSGSYAGPGGNFGMGPGGLPGGLPGGMLGQPQLPPALAAYFAAAGRSNNVNPVTGGQAGLPYNPFMQVNPSVGLPPQPMMGTGGGAQMMPMMGTGGGAQVQGGPPMPPMRPQMDARRMGPRRNLGFGG